jgi:class 3 adenylate cyclase/tetratricopeptide (TPR) repeat protein
MAEQLDPEEWAEVMNEAFRYLTNPIHRYGGTVARLMGDAILAFFGAPVAHEDDPQRAVLAGLAILEEISPFCEEIRAEYGLDFNVRVGINTGSVVVGDIGTDQATEYTAMGDAVNIASRMEESAEPGTVLIAKDTEKHVAPLFELEALGGIDIQGKGEPVAAYKVLQQREQPGSIRGIQGLSSPLVGRESESEILNQRLAELKTGRGGIVNLVGDAGLGKSRMIQELEASWLEEYPEESWYESRGVSYESTRPYSIFIDSTRALFNLKPGDSPEIGREKIATCLPDWPVEQKELATRAVEILLSVQNQDQDPGQEAEALRREFTAAVRSAWKELAIKGPAILVFDDLHWSDRTSVDVLTQLFSLTDDVPILFLCAMRPYRRAPGWQIKNFAETEYPHRYTEIELHPLTEQHSEELIGNLLTVSNLPPELHQLILRKAEGNPFYVEEVIRTLIDEGAVIRTGNGLEWEAKRHLEDISLPDNLQALLIARIDRLDAEIRRTLQLASVIGRSFFFRILEMLNEATGELNQHLTALQRVELIREAARFPELEYMFLHEMTRDAAYETILKRERRKFHQSVGEAIEALFPERIEDEASRLAQHFLEANEFQKAFDYFIMAGDHARRLYANSEAIQAYSKAISLLGTVDVEEDRLVYVYRRRGRTFELINQYDEALANYHELSEIGRQTGRRTLELIALTHEATIYSSPTEKADPELGRRISDQALELARELGNPEGEAKALWNLMLVEGVLRSNEELGLEFGEQSLEIARQYNLKEQLAFTLLDLARMYAGVGRMEDSFAASDESRDLWIELDNQTMLGNSYTSSAFGYFGMGALDKSIQSAKEGLRISQSIGSLWGQSFSNFTIGIVLFEQGRMDEGFEAFNAGIPLGIQAHVSSQYQGYMNCVVSWAYSRLGDYESAMDYARAGSDLLPLLGKGLCARVHYLQGKREKAQAYLDEIYQNLDEFRFYPQPSKSVTCAILGETTLELKEDPVFIALQNELLLEEKNVFTRVFKSDLLNVQAKRFMKNGAIEDAQGIIVEAERLARSFESKRALLEVLTTRFEVETQLGNAAETTRVRNDALEIVDFIAEHISSAELRESFLNTEKVRVLRI